MSSVSGGAVNLRGQGGMDGGLDGWVVIVLKGARVAAKLWKGASDVSG